MAKTKAESSKTAKPTTTRAKLKPFVRYSEELVDTILNRVARGEPLSGVCDQPDMPSRSSFFDWVIKYPDLKDKYEFAIQMRADLYAEETITISDEVEVEAKYGDESVTLDLSSTAVARNRLRVDARKWYAGKLSPKKYGDRIQNDTTLEAGQGLLAVLSSLAPK